ncbi:MAG: GAF and ANTAR domain-containing protein [Actinomycetes bacterium]
MPDLPPRSEASAEFDSGFAVRPEDSIDLTPVLAQMGAVLLSPENITTTIELVTKLATRTIPGTMGSGVSLIDARGKRTTAASDPLVEQADALQYEFDAGPCLTAWRDQVSVVIDNIEQETRWPRWAAEVRGLGVQSMLSVPLVAGGTALGAMKVYSGHPAAYGSSAEYVLQLFAHQAAILLSNTQTLADARQLSVQLTAALHNRDIIGQAKGILLAQGAPDAQAAFTMLVSASQRTNLKVSEVARQLVGSVTARNAGRTAP